MVLAPPGKAPAEDLSLAEGVLRAGQHHLLLVPRGVGEAPRVPSRVLVCVAVGEPGKEDVAFAGRLARHLRAEATICTVLPPADRAHPESGAAVRAERFLAGNRRAMARLGVPVATAIRYGEANEEIRRQIAEGGHDLLVLGVPLPRKGEITLGGFLARLLPQVADLPLLLVRSPEVMP